MRIKFYNTSYSFSCNECAEYKVWTIAEDDGSNPASPLSYAQGQETVLNTSYAGVGVSWSGTYNLLRKTSLRHGKILGTTCKASWINDQEPDLGCLSIYTGYDGGDFMCDWPSSGCDPNACGTLDDYIDNYSCDCICVNLTKCDVSMIGNGVCNPECNWAQKSWDGGDCCLTANAGTCKDPSSPNRNWMAASELKKLINSTSTNNINFYVVDLVMNYDATNVLGYATFPWNSQATTEQGGVVFNYQNGGWGVVSSTMKGITAVHEVGHCLGLYHTHYGVSDIALNSKSATCALTCFEHQPSDPSAPSSPLTGDMFSDTRPTPANYYCSDPGFCLSGSLSSCTCNNSNWVNTPYRNFMGYGPDTCLNNFSAQQSGRIRCYIDTTLYGWKSTATPGNILIPANATYVASLDQINVTWIAPLNPGPSGANLAYRVKRTPAFAANPDGIIVTGGRTYFLDTSFAYDTSYTYAVRALNDYGETVNYSPSSPAVSVQVPVSKLPPSVLSFAPTNQSTIYSTSCGLYLVKFDSNLTLWDGASSGSTLNCPTWLQQRSAQISIYGENGARLCYNIGAYVYTTDYGTPAAAFTISNISPYSGSCQYNATCNGILDEANLVGSNIAPGTYTVVIGKDIASAAKAMAANFTSMFTISDCASGSIATCSGTNLNTTSNSTPCSAFQKCALATCTQCPAGTKYVPASGSSTSMCTPCGSGTYTNSAGSVSCSNCNAPPTGYIWSGVGATSASCSGGSSTALCAPGYGTSGNASDTTCSVCPTGTYSTTSSLAACQPCNSAINAAVYHGVGATSANCSIGGTASVWCKVGYGWDEAAGACLACPAGFYNNETSTLKPCSACMALTGDGQTYIGSGATNSNCSNSTGNPLIGCLPGYYLTGEASNNCSLCPIGTYRSNVGTDLSCQTCDSPRAGEIYVGIGATRSNCTTTGGAGNATIICDRGYGWNSTQGGCVMCASGYYSDSLGMSPCAPCSQLTGDGQVYIGSGAVASNCSNSTGSIQVGCLPGYFMKYPDNSTCAPCPSGRYNSYAGADASCSNCVASPGKIYLGTGATKNDCTGGSASYTCAPGFTAGSGSTCIACPSGSYKNETGLQPCTDIVVLSNAASAYASVLLMMMTALVACLLPTTTTTIL